jgi:hypothetical protein
MPSTCSDLCTELKQLAAYVAPSIASASSGTDLLIALMALDIVGR